MVTACDIFRMQSSGCLHAPKVKIVCFVPPDSLSRSLSSKSHSYLLSSAAGIFVRIIFTTLFD